MKLSPDRKAGLYITVSVHLAVIIVLLAVRIAYHVQQENSFVLDFTQQEEQERRQEQAELHEMAEQDLERMLQAVAAATRGAEMRNVAVDRSALKDDKGIDAEQLYRDAERLAQELRDGQNRQEEDPGAFAATQPAPVKEEQEKPRVYSGPSVLSWSLDGRKASHLPIPAYRCYGAGEVTVIITVNNQGKVVNAKVDDHLSTADNCLRTFATRAARLSLFSASPTAPSRQMGTITYAFIAQ